jgi:F0F1-type ATP synthase assembly protein I
MVEYSRSDIKKVGSSFIIEPFHRKRKKANDDKYRLIDAMDLGIYLIIPLLAGLGIGVVLDNRTGIKPVGIITGLLLGAVGSFFNLIKIVRQFSKHA